MYAKENYVRGCYQLHHALLLVKLNLADVLQFTKPLLRGVLRALAIKQCVDVVPSWTA